MLFLSPPTSSFLIVLEKDLISFQSIKQFISDALVSCLVLVIVHDFIIESLKVYYVASSAYLAFVDCVGCVTQSRGL